MPQLCWRDNGDPDGDSVTFWVDVWTTGHPYDPSVEQSGWIAQTCWQPQTLSGPGDYLWHAQARDSHGATSSYTSEWSFQVALTAEVFVPAGEFPMGSETSDPNADDDEKPRHPVYLYAFWIDRAEATNGQYAACVAAGACSPPLQTNSRSRASYYGNPIYEDYPVIYVSWSQATAYCAWAGKRLPTEAEWEKSARGTDGRIYPWGNFSPASTLLNYNGNVGDTTEVGSYPAGASPYGAQDMAGNVWEWVADWYGSGYYAISPYVNPTGPNSGDYRVLRGGAWDSHARLPRSANRRWYPPSSNTAFDFLGFRCVRSP